MLSVVICDDNPVFSDYAKHVVKKELGHCNPEIKCFSNAEQLLKCFENGDFKPDIAILDIEMEGLDGITLAQRMNQMLPDCAIIFLTAYIMRYASSVYEADHIWMVSKEEVDKFLPQALKKALQICRTDDTDQKELLIRSGRRMVALAENDVLYIERFQYKTYLHLRNGQQMETRQSPLEFLSDSTQKFVRCHQGYWVNMAHVVELVRDEFVLDNGERILITRTFREKARGAFFARFK